VRSFGRRGRASFAGVALCLMLAVAGCGGASRPLAVHPGPIGCTRHLVFAREGSANRAMVALSFDDSPGPRTEAIVKTLLSHHAKATFFIIGNRVPGHVQLLRAMVGDGMELGNHSYSHPRDLVRMAVGAFRELEMANSAIRHATGFEPCLFRPPYGQLTPDLVQRAKEAGLTTAKWNVDPADWTHPGVATISERVLSGARPGSIVVLHDNFESRGQSLRALPAIIEGLQTRGLHLVTISELLGDRFIWPGRG
jgi:peptidoglycan-N-acetylglucosamine deacetylase